MVPLEVLERSEIIKNEYPSLISVIQKIAVPPIRNQATIGGNICLDNRCIFYNQSEFWRSVQKPCFKLGGELCHAVEKGKRCQAVYSGDLAPFLIALGANVKIISKEGEKLIKLSEFFTGRGEKPNILKPNELLTEIQIPPAEPGVGLSYEKLRIREGMDFPMAGVAVKVKEKQDGTIEKIKVVLGSVGTAPIEVSKATTILAGQKLTEELLEKISKETMEVARPVGNLIINSEYRRKMIGVLTKRALIQAFKMAKGNWS
jgi:4-hydroxybenzoyl-CoA reductase subunit beta